LSGESWNDGVFGEAAAGSDSGAASAGEVVAIGAGNAFDDAKVAQAGELPGEGGRRALGDQRQEVGAAEAGDVEAETLQGGEQGLFGAAEKLRPLTVRPLTGRGWVRRPSARMPAEKSSRLERYSR
jgi:hypothetical protein